jgi:hypothetical protein
MLAGNKDLSCRLAGLEKKYDTQFRVVFDAIRALMQPAPSTGKRRIGFIEQVPKCSPTQAATLAARTP